ncbi:uncharacterized protein J3R85_004957 [Psidium guajava]|nr:uncharacterized protein J3R85_004957 [Psidium guajava]
MEISDYPLHVSEMFSSLSLSPEARFLHSPHDHSSLSTKAEQAIELRLLLCDRSGGCVSVPRRSLKWPLFTKGCVPHYLRVSFFVFLSVSSIKLGNEENRKSIVFIAALGFGSSDQARFRGDFCCGFLASDKHSNYGYGAVEWRSDSHFLLVIFFSLLFDSRRPSANHPNHTLPLSFLALKSFPDCQKQARFRKAMFP